jgi:hypothetical protein
VLVGFVGRRTAMLARFRAPEANLESAHRRPRSSRVREIAGI